MRRFGIPQEGLPSVRELLGEDPRPKTPEDEAAEQRAAEERARVAALRIDAEAGDPLAAIRALLARGEVGWALKVKSLSRGLLIRSAREAAGMTLDQLAAASRTSRTECHRIEAGHASKSLEDVLGSLGLSIKKVVDVVRPDLSDALHAKSAKAEKAA